MNGNRDIGMFRREPLQSLVARTPALIFDLFHTLTALESTWSGGPTTSQMLGIDIEAWDAQLHESSRDRLTGQVTDPVKIVRRMAHAVDPAIPLDLIERATRNRIERFEGALVRAPEATRTTLATLKKMGKSIAVCSNADVMEIAGWSKSPIAHLFDVVVFSCQVGCVKPEREIYDICLRRLGVSAEDCLFVGDGGSHELEGARAVGLTTVMIAGIIREIWPERIDERKRFADYSIETLDELLS